MEVHQETPKVLSDEYVAGLFDGEGCVTCQRQWIKGKYEKYPRVQLQVTITNTNLEVLALLEIWFGGGTTRKESRTPPNRQICYHWRVIGKKALLKFLRVVYPYLIIKRDEVYQAIRFAETLREENLGCNPLSAETHALREEVYEALKKQKNKKPYQNLTANTV